MVQRGGVAIHRSLNLNFAFFCFLSHEQMGKATAIIKKKKQVSYRTTITKRQQRNLEDTDVGLRIILYQVPGIS